MARHTEVRRLDLADLASVRAFAAGWTEPLPDQQCRDHAGPAGPHPRRLRTADWHQPPRPVRNSKLANLLFTLDLQHRLTEAGRGVQAVAAHPGIATTNLTSHIRGIRGTLGRAFKHLFNDAERGALPTLYAATQDVPGACYVGPAGPATSAVIPNWGHRRKGEGRRACTPAMGPFGPPHSAGVSRQ